MSLEQNERPESEKPGENGAESPCGANSTQNAQTSSAAPSPQSGNGAFGRPGGGFPNGAPLGNPKFSGGFPISPFRVPTPRPSGFGAELAKCLISTVAGVAVFCFLGFFLSICALATLASLVGGSPYESDLVSETVLSGDDDAPRKIAILPIKGIIETEEDGFIAEAIEIVRDDDRIGGLVLRIDSPGGTVSGSDYYWRLLKDLKAELEIPVVVSMGDVAASGGYYIATVGDKIFAERSTETGSIGVVIPMFDASALCEKLGVASSAVVSGPMKGMGDFMKKPSAEERAIFQGIVDETYEQFLDVVREGRPWFRGEEGDFASAPRRTNASDVAIQAFVETETPAVEVVSTGEENDEADPSVANAKISDDDRDAALRRVADGRIYTAKQAKELHLIDEIGFLDDAVDEAIALAGLDPDRVQVVRYDEIESVFDSLGLASAKAQNDRVEKAAKALAAPKAYYLAPRALPFGD